jgi:hypothetical protein
MKYPSLPLPAAAARYRPLVIAGTRLAVAGALAAGVAACSSSGSAAAGGTPADGSSPAASGSSASSTSPAVSATSRAPSNGKGIVGLLTFKGSFDLRGATTQHSSFVAFPGVTSPASSCARIGATGTPAAKGEQLFQIPAPAAGSNVYLTVQVLRYHGPGVYGKAAIRPVGASVVVGSTSYNPLATQATASATVKADGSGTFTFANAAGTTSADPTLSGTFSWTCSG